MRGTRSLRFHKQNRRAAHYNQVRFRSKKNYAQEPFVFESIIKIIAVIKTMREKKE